MNPRRADVTLSPAILYLFFSVAIQGTLSHEEASELKRYIVYVRKPSDVTILTQLELDSWYASFLPATAATDATQRRLVYSYSAVSAFAAKLTEEEVAAMANTEGFINAHPDKTVSLHTTHTPDFLGLVKNNGSFWTGSEFGSGVIIGVIDSGITPKHPSFNDHGMPPPPARWKGECWTDNTSFRCNNKIIGAKSFNSYVINGDSRNAPVDINGHGTHTASTAAGNFVPDANVLGSGGGTAVGIAPRAHLAIYQACNLMCFMSDVVAAFDAAIKDGVDVISLSLGHKPMEFSDDSLAVWTYAAVKNGIFVSCSAGNWGPQPFTVANGAPWVLTVAASTIDRRIRATVRLGDGTEFDGQSAFQPHHYSSTMLPLILPLSSGRCTPTNLDESTIKGKMVLCQQSIAGGILAGEFVKLSGGLAMIHMNTEVHAGTTLAQVHVLPASHISYTDGLKFLNYINSSKNPTASIIFKGTDLGKSPVAPAIASFSSRGPNKPSRGILKPDISGPGASVLAAWPFEIAVGPPEAKQGRVKFNMISGTSMSAPHLSGIAALLKSKHPDWSTAMIKSAIMTTSDVIDRSGQPIKDEQLRRASYLSMGAGHVNPAKASDPGLVYDLNFEDYKPYLCGLFDYAGEDAYKLVESVTGEKTNCPRKIKEAELNSPAIVVSLNSSTIVTVNRTVMNVGDPPASTYKVEIDVPKGVKISVSPDVLDFKDAKENRTFTVTISSIYVSNAHLLEGSLKWVSEKYEVRSPIVVLPQGME